jgi:hypothetical protein
LWRILKRQKTIATMFSESTDKFHVSFVFLSNVYKMKYIIHNRLAKISSRLIYPYQTDSMFNTFRAVTLAIICLNWNISNVA